MANRSIEAAGLRRRHRARYIVSAISLAEVVSVLYRRGLHTRVPAALDAMRAEAEIVQASPDLLVLAGQIHAGERARVPDLSLADAIILATAKRTGGTVLTRDRGLAKNQQGVKVQIVP